MLVVIKLQFSLIKSRMFIIFSRPIFIRDPIGASLGPRQYIYFEIFSVDEHDKQHELLSSFIVEAKFSLTAYALKFAP
jgi:formamidase